MVNTKCDTSYYDSRGYKRKIFDGNVLYESKAKLSEHWRFLQVQYSLTDTGRVIQKINPKRLTAMRRKMKKLAPKLTEKEFTDFYKSWFKNHYKIMSKKQRSNMDTLFNQLKEVTKCTLSPLPMAKS